MPKNPERITLRPRPPGLRDAPALTLMDSPEFRVRIGTHRSVRSPKLKGFIGRIKSLTAKHAAGAGGFKSRHLSKFGRGGSAAASVRVRVHPQRVTVKSRVVRHSRYRAPGGAIRALREHIDYLGRGGVAEDKGRGVVFDMHDDLDWEDLRAFRERIVDDRHHFRFIVSPEAGAALELKDYAREFVTAMESDLGTPLEWLGVAHYDTDNPHLHLMVRGKDSQLADLVINREYMSHGMRLQAMEVATRHLGPRLAKDIERSLKRDLTADRVTGIDLRLAQASEGHPQGLVSALHADDGSLAGERRRLRTLARLQHLESLGLAREVKPAVWQPDIDLLESLRRLSIRGDIIKLMHERMRGTDPGIASVIFNKENPPLESVVGRVYARGAVDELSDINYLSVEARDGKAYYVPLSEFSEVPGQEARLGSIVRIASTLKNNSSSADREIVRFAARDQGAIIKVERLSLSDLDGQTHENGVTWLDREIDAGADVGASARIGATRFERQIVQALKERGQHLKRLGLAEEFNGQLRTKARFIDELYARELQDAGRRLQSRYGELVRLSVGQILNGRVEAIEQLPSGPHAVVAMPDRYSLVPASPGLSRQVGRTIGLSIGRGRQLGLSDSSPFILTIRYRFLDLKPTRKLGRSL
jgi:type IV secretory pathway VirD2 relaxase